MIATQNTSRETVTRICMDALQRAALEHGLSIAAIMSQSRTQALSHARQDAMFYARQEGISYVLIGEQFGRDHSTVISNVKQASYRKEKAIVRNCFGMVRFKSSRKISDLPT